MRCPMFGSGLRGSTAPRLAEPFAHPYDVGQKEIAMHRTVTGQVGRGSTAPGPHPSPGARGLSCLGRPYPMGTTLTSAR
jgi:hypothetical protein